MSLPPVSCYTEFLLPFPTNIVGCPLMVVIKNLIPRDCHLTGPTAADIQQHLFHQGV